jgi:hypothetical protein
MGRRLRRTLVLAVLVLLWTTIAGGPALAAGAGQFADNQPLIVDLAATPSFDVPLVNTSTSERSFALTVVGPAATHLTPTTTDVPAKPGLQTVTLTVVAGAVPAQGTLVLTGPDGTLARQPIKLVGTPSGQDPAAVIPGSFETLSLPSTSWVPSLFRPLPSSASRWSTATVLLVLVGSALALWYRHERSRNAVRSALLALAMIAASAAGLVLFAGAASALIDDARNEVRVNSIEQAVAPAAPGSVSGALTSDNGDSGRVTVTGATLAVAGLDQAGAYSGSIDTQPARDGGDVKVTAKVRDWWLYALLAVAAGIFIGWLVSVFYTSGQPVRQLRVDIANLRRRTAGMDSEWDLATVGRDWNGIYPLTGYLDEQLPAGHDAAADGDPSRDAETVRNLTTVVEAAHSVRRRIDALARASEALGAAFENLILDPAQRRPHWVRPVVRSADLSGHGPASAANLVQQKEKAVAVAERTAEQAQAVADRMNGLAARIETLTDPPRRKQLRDIWNVQAVALLAATDVDAVKAVAAELTDLDQKIRAVVPASSTTAVPHGASQLPEAVVRIMRRITAALPGLSRRPQSAAATGRHDLDDLLTIEVEVTPEPGDGDLTWRFSDGSSSEPFAAAAGVTTRLTTRHQFTRSDGVVTAEVVGLNGRVLGDRWIRAVSTRGATARLQTALNADRRTVAMVAGLLAIGSGMVALYLPNATWGSAGNYMTALLWGAATAEGIKAAVGIAGNRWQIL